MVANVTISQNPKEKKKNLGINLKYNKNLFSLKIHFPIKLFIFSSLEKKNYEWIFVIWKFEAKRLQNLATKKQKKISCPKVIEVFED
jgi:hypothetical protein